VARPGGLATRGKLVSNCFLLPQTPTETVPLSGERKHSRPDGSQINRIPYVFDTLQNVTIEFRAPSTLASYQTTRIVVCPAYEYQTTRMQRSRPGSSLFSPSPSVEGRSSVEARDRTRPTPRSRARRLVHAFTPSARREQVPQSCSPPGPPNLATLVATFHRHAKFTISTDQRAKLSKPRGAAVQPTPSAARLLVVGLGVEPSARPRSTPSMPISAPSLCALPALLALPALPT
jgi:hypothetical protein